MPTKGHVHVCAQSAPSPTPSGARAGQQAAYNLNATFPPPALSFAAPQLAHNTRTPWRNVPCYRFPGIEHLRS